MEDFVRVGAEYVLGAFIDSVIDKLVTWSGQYVFDFILGDGIDHDDRMKKWSETLRTIHAVLEDAEQKQLTSEEVKLWLDDLHELAYDVEDLVDELAIEAQSGTTTRARTSGNKFAKVMTSATSLVKAKFKPDDEMKTKIKDISGRLDKIFERKMNLGLTNSNVIGERVVQSSRQTTSLPPTRVFGREKEKKEIVDMLMKPEADSTQVPVITILGMGGLGKTTLAQDIYHDDKVVKCFDLKAWVCVSDVFDVANITKTILASQPTSDKLENFDLNKLQEKLKQMLSGKRFLLVLDDIWNENYGEWDVLRRPFLYGATGSRILATTRNKPVASTMSRTNEQYVLSVLGDDYGLSLLALHALRREDFHDHQDLKETSEKIVKKCGCLPLAIKTIAGLLLHIPQERKQWEDVLNNKKWAEESDDMLPALRLSYYHLPYHLKQCFAYCSIIPKDYIFNKTELILLWMAEGLLQQPAGGSNKQIEDFGDYCFQELLSRSFLQLTNGSTTQFIMHDLINDLAVHVAGERYFRMDEDWDNSHKNYKISEMTRHLSFICQTYEVSNKFNIFNTALRSRTFLPLPPRKFCMTVYAKFYISDTILALSLSRLKNLRVLNLRGYQIVELPNSIGALKHLRYLNLSYTNIKQLPQVVCHLYSLQTLSLHSCRYLHELPSSIGCLTNLQHLDLEDTPKLKVMPSGIGKLTSLQTLSKVSVGRDIGSCNLKDLKDLRNLHGTLSIEELQNVTDEQDADLRSKEHLEILKLQWNLKKFVSSAHDKQVLEKLKPHCNLKELEIKGYGSDGFPSWVGGQSMSNVVKIHLQECSEITHLPSLGELPLLKDLVIEGLVNIASVGAEFYGRRAEEIAFPSLETLKFREMSKWNVWSPPVAGKGLFPCLRDLKIDGCRELGSIPTLDLPFLCSLELKDCKEVWLKRLISLTSLKKISIKDVAGVTCLPEQFVNSLVSLENAIFRDCEQLGSLWRSNGTSLEGPFNRLNSLTIESCHNLISLLEEGEQGLPKNLKKLEVRSCGKLEKLPNGLHGLASLQEISISRCGNLICLLEEGEQGLPRNLKILDVSWCEKLKKLPNGLHGLASLQEIRISGCPSLVWDMTDRLPKSLKGLELSYNHEGFRNIIRTWSDGSMSSSSFFASFESLAIGGCPGLESFGVTCFPMLSRLNIWNCVDLKSLPDGIQGLASLEYLGIFDCGNLGSVRDKDLAPSLVGHEIMDVGGEQKKEKSVVLSDWGFHRLTSLKELSIGGFGFEEVVSFEQVGNSNSTSYLFPPSLTYLDIADFSNLKSLSKGLHNLTSLRELSIRNFPNLESLSYSLHNLTSLRVLDIRDCPNLESLSYSLQNLTSLRELIIWSCPKLESLAGADDDEASLQIISSLHYLHIRGDSSEVLRERCKKEKGKYWPTIKHILNLRIEEY